MQRVWQCRCQPTRIAPFAVLTLFLPAVLAAQTPPVSYAVVIGISEYEDIQMPRFPGADANARAVADLLRSPRTGLPAKNITTLINKDANAFSVRLGLQNTLIRKASATDSVLVFIAGRALADNAGASREGFLMTYDSNPGAKRTTAFPLAQLGQFLQNSKAGGIYMFVDLGGDPLGPELEALGKKPGVVLTAISSGSDLSFSRLLPDALSSKLPAGTAGEVVAFLKGRVPGGPGLFAAREPAAILFRPPLEVGAAAPTTTPPARASKPAVADLPPPDPTPKTAPPTQPNRTSELEKRSSDAAALVARARTEINERRWSDAIEHSKSALQLDPRVTQASQLLKDAYVGQGSQFVREKKWDEAIKTAQGAKAIDASDQQVTELWRDANFGKLSADGTAALQQQKWDEAMAAFKAALALKPDQRSSDGLALAELHKTYDAGVAAFQGKDFAAARDKLDQVVKSQSQFKDKSVQQNLASLYYDAGLKLKQTGVQLLLRVGMDQYNRGDYSSSKTIFEQVLANDPGNKEALGQLVALARGDDLNALNEVVRRGEQKLANQDWDGALKDFGDALVRNPNDTRARNGQKSAQDAIRRKQRNVIMAATGIGVPLSVLLVMLAPTFRRARLFARFGYNLEAVRLLERLLERNPTRADVLTQLVDLYGKTRQRELALQACRNYLRLKPDDIPILWLVGESLYERREYAEAHEVYQKIVGLGRCDDKICSRLLEIQDALADNSDGLQVYERALKNNPENPGLNRLISRHYLQQGRRDSSALEIFRRALVAEPSNALLRLACAEAYWEDQKCDDVIVESKLILKHDPDNRSAISLLLRASQNCGSLESALALVDSGELSPLTTLAACEGAAELDPALRPAIHQRYLRMISDGSNGSGGDGTCTVRATTPECAIYRGHISIDDNLDQAAIDHLNRATAHEPKESDYLIELIRVYRRFLDTQRAKAAYPAFCAEFLFRLGELLREQGEWRGALDSFKEIAKLPEWMVRCAKATEDILDGLPPEQLGARFFEDVGWQVSFADSSQGTSGHADLVVNPPEGFDSTLFSFFEKSQVRCFARPITLDDVVQLKRELAGQEDLNREFTFVVSPLRPRQDVFALIYALLTEEPSLRIIPLESTAVKQATIEVKSKDTLEQLLRLWVGQGDLFDVHSPIADAGTFFGRGQFIHTLTTKIIQGENFGIFGLRKVGKTSLVFQLRENLPKNLIGYVDLQSVASRRCEEIYFRLSSALRRELRVKYPDLPPVESKLTDYDASRAYPSIATDFHNELLKIKAMLEAQGQQPRVLLLLDEIELLLPHGQNKGFAGYEDFFRQVRGLYQQEGFVLSGVVGADPSACRAGKWGDRDNPVFQYYDEVFLTPLDRTECDQMVHGIGEVMGVTFDAPALSIVYEESGGHPYVARQLCSRIVSRNVQRPLNVVEPLVNEGIEDYIAQRPDYFVGVFRGYLSSEARQIMQVAAASDDNEVSRVQLLAFSEKAGMDRVSLEKALQDLELFNLMTRDKERYGIKIRLLRRWIRRSWLGLE